MTNSREALLGRFRAGLVARLKALRELLTELDPRAPDPTTLRSFLGELHTLKGEARMLGLDSVSSVAHQLEDAFSSEEAAHELPLAVSGRALSGMLAALDERTLSATERIELLSAVADELGVITPESSASASTSASTSTSAPAPAVEHAEPGSAPAAKVRWTQVDAAAVDALCEKVAELSAAFGGLLARTKELGRVHATSAIAEDSERCRILLDDSTSRAWALRLVPVEPTLHELAEHARRLAERLGKSIDVELRATGVQLERDVLDELWEPLLHLVQNAVDHGLESPAERGHKPAAGTLRLSAESDGPSVRLSVEDDGRGVDIEAVRQKAVARGLFDVQRAERLSEVEVLDVLFQQGFSTRDSVSQVSGRGLGLDVVRRKLESLGGRVEITSFPELGTRFLISVPFAITKERLLVVALDAGLYALPARVVHAVLAAEVTEASFFHYEGAAVPLRSLTDLLGFKRSGQPEVRLVVDLAGRRYGLSVPQILGEWELIRRPAEPILASGEAIGASALLHDGRLVLVLELGHLQRGMRRPARTNGDLLRAERPAPKRVLVADDSPVIRELLSEILASAGLLVETAQDGLAALSSIERSAPDLVLSDVEMPRMGGFELLTEIRQRSQRLPVIMLTTRGSVEDRRRAASLGANAYLIKTEFQGDALLEVVRRFVSVSS
jgi:two-component system, chemotaxis family, sensor kinase CheA